MHNRIQFEKDPFTNKINLNKRIQIYEETVNKDNKSVEVKEFDMFKYIMIKNKVNVYSFFNFYNS